MPKPNPDTTVVMPYILKGQEVWLIMEKKENPDNDEFHSCELPMGFMPRVHGEKLPEFDNNDIFFAVANKLYNILKERGMTITQQMEKSKELSRWDQIVGDDE